MSGLEFPLWTAVGILKIIPSVILSQNTCMLVSLLHLQTRLTHSFQSYGVQPRWSMLSGMTEKAQVFVFLWNQRIPLLTTSECSFYGCNNSRSNTEPCYSIKSNRGESETPHPYWILRIYHVSLFKNSNWESEIVYIFFKLIPTNLSLCSSA